VSVSRFCVSFDTGEKDIWIDGPETYHMLCVKRSRIGVRLSYLMAWEMNAVPRSLK
jgi:hypothetical protein